MQLTLTSIPHFLHHYTFDKQICCTFSSTLLHNDHTYISNQTLLLERLIIVDNLSNNALVSKYRLVLISLIHITCLKQCNHTKEYPSNQTHLSSQPMLLYTTKILLISYFFICFSHSNLAILHRRLHPYVYKGFSSSPSPNSANMFSPSLF